MNSSKKVSDQLETSKLAQSNIADTKKTIEIIDTKKILEIFESQYTEQLYDRKANYILKFCKSRKEGFYFDEIPELTRIVEYSILDLNEGVVAYLWNSLILRPKWEMP